jgi:hypothetical protein
MADLERFLRKTPLGPLRVKTHIQYQNMQFINISQKNYNRIFPSKEAVVPYYWPMSNGHRIWDVEWTGSPSTPISIEDGILPFLFVLFLFQITKPHGYVGGDGKWLKFSLHIRAIEHGRPGFRIVLCLLKSYVEELWNLTSMNTIGT